EIEHLVVEPLQRALGEGDKPHGQIEARQPSRRLHEVRQVLEIDRDVLALADAAHGGDETDGGVRFDHELLPMGTTSPIVSWRAPRRAAGRPRRGSAKSASRRRTCYRD